jgi:hypothetical protein
MTRGNHAKDQAGTQQGKGKRRPNTRQDSQQPKNPNQKTGEGTQRNQRRNGCRQETAQPHRTESWDTAVQRQTRSDVTQPEKQENPQQKIFLGLCRVVQQPRKRPEARDGAAVWSKGQRQGPAGKATGKQPHGRQRATQTEKKKKSEVLAWWTRRRKGKRPKQTAASTPRSMLQQRIFEAVAFRRPQTRQNKKPAKKKRVSCAVQQPKKMLETTHVVSVLQSMPCRCDKALLDKSRPTTEENE